MDLKYSRHFQNPTKGTVGKWGGIFNSSLQSLKYFWLRKTLKSKDNFIILDYLLIIEEYLLIFWNISAHSI